MTLLRDLRALLRHLPDLVTDWCDRRVLAAHQPEMVPADDLGQWPNGVMPWCLRCDAAWPCDSYANALDQLKSGHK